MAGRRLVLWRGLEEWLAEAAQVRFEANRLEASGTQLGAEPEPYRLDYDLATGPGWVTARLQARCGGGRLDLRRGPDGAWAVNGEARPDLAGALDCDLQNSPLTNTMPILRERRGPVELAMAWVALPELSVRVSRQRYEPLDGRRVRYISLDSDFSADLDVDEDGIVTRYPHLAEQL